jgi:hypothetical protein
MRVLIALLRVVEAAVDLGWTMFKDWLQLRKKGTAR